MGKVYGQIWQKESLFHVLPICVHYCTIWMFAVKGLFAFCLFVSISSLVSAFAPNYITLLIFRGVVGFGISGSAQA